LYRQESYYVPPSADGYQPSNAGHGANATNSGDESSSAYRSGDQAGKTYGAVTAAASELAALAELQAAGGAGANALGAAAVAPTALEVGAPAATPASPQTASSGLAKGSDAVAQIHPADLRPPDGAADGGDVVVLVPEDALAGTIEAVPVTIASVEEAPLTAPAAGTLAGLLPPDVPALGRTVDRLFTALDEAATSLADRRWVASLAPWVVAAMLAGGAAFEVRRRRRLEEWRWALIPEVVVPLPEDAP
jgi:hypothetical protein